MDAHRSLRPQPDEMTLTSLRKETVVYDRSESSALLHVPLEWSASRDRWHLPRLSWQLVLMHWQRGCAIDARMRQVRAGQMRCFDQRIGR